jgi:hypothetical protein
MGLSAVVDILCSQLREFRSSEPKWQLVWETLRTMFL